TNADGQSASLVNAFTYNAPAPPPTLSAVSPTSGPTAGGTLVTLTGTNFQAGATVTIGGTTATAANIISIGRAHVSTPVTAPPRPPSPSLHAPLPTSPIPMAKALPWPTPLPTMHPPPRRR